MPSMPSMACNERYSSMPIWDRIQKLDDAGNVPDCHRRVDQVGRRVPGACGNRGVATETGHLGAHTRLTGFGLCRPRTALSWRKSPCDAKRLLGLLCHAQLVVFTTFVNHIS